MGDNYTELSWDNSPNYTPNYLLPPTKFRAILEDNYRIIRLNYTPELCLLNNKGKE